jgi:hypothetical protein
VDAELTETNALQLAIRRMVLDALDVVTEAITSMKDWRMAIGEARASVEVVACQSAEPVEMRLDMAP